MTHDHTTHPLRQHLEEAAATTTVDTTRMRAAVLRAADQPVPSKGRVSSLVAAAAAVAAIAFTVGTANLVAGDRPQSGPASGAGFDSAPGSASLALVAGPVGDDWACDHQATYTEGLSDPTLAPDAHEPVFVNTSDIDPPTPPSEMANAGGRYEYRIDGDHGELLYGSSDGSRTATSQLDRGEGGNWSITSRTLCSGPDGSPYATDHSRQLRVRPASASAPDDVSTGADRETVDRLAGEVVVVDTRSYFDQIGRLRNTTLRAYPLTDCAGTTRSCIGTSRVVGGDGTSSAAEGSSEYGVVSRSTGGGRAPGAGPLSCNRYPDIFYTQPTSTDLTLCESYVTDGENISGAEVIGADGNAYPMQIFRGRDWKGAYLAVLVEGYASSGSINLTNGTDLPLFP